MKSWIGWSSPGIVATVLGLTSTMATARADELTRPEQALSEFVVAHEHEALALLKRLVDINSGTMNFPGIQQVGAILGEELEHLGFTTRWIDGASFGRAGHLVAQRPGGGLSVLLIGHLDTVFEPDSPFQRFERVDATHARGPGVTDMKGGNVILLQAVRALAAVDALDRLRVTVVLTGDEERAGQPLELARAALIEAARDADIALGFEDGDGDPTTAVIARRGAISWELVSRGRPAHSSQVFREDIGAGAIFELARVLDGFRTRLAGEEYLTFNPGLVLGGTTVGHVATESRGNGFGKNNVIAEHGIATGDLRTLTPQQLAKTQTAMATIAQASLPHTSSTLTFADGYPPLAPTDGNRRLLELYSKASEDLGYGPVVAVDPAKAGAADVSFTAGHVAMAIDGIGLMGKGGHTVDETADLLTLRSQAQRAALLLYRLSQLDALP